MGRLRIMPRRGRYDRPGYQAANDLLHSHHQTESIDSRIRPRAVGHLHHLTVVSVQKEAFQIGRCASSRLPSPERHLRAACRVDRDAEQPGRRMKQPYTAGSAWPAPNSTPTVFEKGLPGTGAARSRREVSRGTRQPTCRTAAARRFARASAPSPTMPNPLRHPGSPPAMYCPSCSHTEPLRLRSARAVSAVHQAQDSVNELDGQVRRRTKKASGRAPQASACHARPAVSCRYSARGRRAPPRISLSPRAPRPPRCRSGLFRLSLPLSAARCRSS